MVQAIVAYTFCAQKMVRNCWRTMSPLMPNGKSISKISSTEIKHIPQGPIREDMGEPPTIIEVQDTIRSLKNNKATGPDGIPAEILKEGGLELLYLIHALLLKVWEKEELPSELRDALIVTIFKKGDKAESGNFRGISLLSTTDKVLIRVLANRLLPLSEEVLPESQCVFRPARGTADMISTAWQLQEKCCEKRQPLYMAFIDLTKAFVMVDRQALWSILSRYIYIRILRLLYDSMEVTVLSNGGTKSEPFTVKTGMHHCTHAVCHFHCSHTPPHWRRAATGIELMADSSTLTGLRPRVKSTAPQLRSYSMWTIMLSPHTPQKTSRAFRMLLTLWRPRSYINLHLTS